MRALICALLLLLSNVVTPAQSTILRDSLLQEGERLQYKVKWKGLAAAKLQMEVQPAEIALDAYQLVMKVDTIGLVRDLMPWSDKLVTIVDKKTLLPQSTTISERQDASKFFNYPTATLTNTVVLPTVQSPTMASATIVSPSLALTTVSQDLVALFWWLRRLTLQPEIQETVTVFSPASKQTIELYVTRGQQATIDTWRGKVMAQELVIKLREKQTFTDNYHIRFWVSKDAQRLPLLITADPPFGRLQIELTAQTQDVETEE
jgi:Protein of unknown function (DUF3108)